MRTLSFILAFAFVLAGPSMAGSSEQGLPGIGTFAYRAPRKIAAFLNLCESDCHNRIRGCGYDGSIRFF